MPSGVPQQPVRILAQTVQIGLLEPTQNGRHELHLPFHSTFYVSFRHQPPGFLNRFSHVVGQIHVAQFFCLHANERSAKAVDPVLLSPQLIPGSAFSEMHFPFLIVIITGPLKFLASHSTSQPLKSSVP